MMNYKILGLFVYWAVLVGVFVPAVNGNIIYMGDDEDAYSYPGTAVGDEFYVGDEDSSSPSPGKEVCTVPPRQTCAAGELTTVAFVHQCVTALFTIYVTDEPFIDSYSLKLTKYCPAEETVIDITDCFPLLVTEPPITKLISTEYCYCETQAPETFEVTAKFSYYVTVPPEAIKKEVYITFQVPGRPETQTIRESVTALVLGSFTYQSFSAAAPYRIGGARTVTRYQMHFRKLESQAPEQKIFSLRLVNENTEVAQPEVYTFVYESYETEEPEQTSYVIDYTSYVEVPSQVKEIVFTYTEYVTDKPSLVEFTEILTYLAELPLVKQEFSTEITVYVTKPVTVVRAEVTFTFYETVQPLFEERTVEITFYVTQAQGVDVIPAVITEFVTIMPRQARLLFSYNVILPGYTKAIQLTAKYTAYLPPEMGTDTVSTNYAVYQTLPIESTCVVVTFPIHVTANIVVDEFTKAYTALGVAPLYPKTCHRSYSHSLKQHLGTEDIVIQLTRFVTDEPEITSAVCQFTVCMPECVPSLPGGA